MEACREAAVRHRGIEQALQMQLDVKKEAVKTAMQCLYWLVKLEILHTGHYNSLLKAVKFMGYEQLKHLHQGVNAKYTSQRIIQEFLKVMAGQLEQQMFCSLQFSTFFP